MEVGPAYRIPVFIDTSSIRAEYGPQHGALATLAALAADKIVTIHLHRLVLRELASGRAQEYRAAWKAKRLAEAARPISWMAEPKRSALDQALNALLNSRESCRDEIAAGVEAWVRQVGAKIIEIGPDDARAVWELYFGGALPFKQPKNRADLPDAFIYEGLRRWAEGTAAPIHVVVGDSALRRACEQLPNVVVHDSIGKFVTDADVTEGIRAHQEWRTTAFWLPKAKQALENASDTVRREVTDAVFRQLAGKDVVSEEFLTDENRGVVDGIGAVNVRLDYDRIEDQGKDAALVPVEVEIDPLTVTLFIEKSVYWALGDDESERLSVWDADWNDHYVAAEAEMPARAKGVLRVDFETDENEEMRVVAVELDDLGDVKLEPVA